jgi:hypothetical protein
VTFGGDEGWREASVMEKDVCSRPREEGGDGDVGGSATFQEKRGGGEASIPGGVVEKIGRKENKERRW